MRLKSLFLVAFLSLSVLNCKNTEGDTVIELVTAKDMDSLIEMEKVLLVDVRTPAEYAEGHLEGAININFNDKNFADKIAKIDKSQPVAVYCGKGGRSARCSAYMKNAGFTKIYDLNGGITEWKFKGKKVVK